MPHTPPSSGVSTGHKPSPKSSGPGFESLNNILLRSKELPQVHMSNGSLHQAGEESMNDIPTHHSPTRGFGRPVQPVTSSPQPSTRAQTHATQETEVFVSQLNDLAGQLGMSIDEVFRVVKEEVLSRYRDTQKRRTRVPSKNALEYPKRSSVDITVKHRDGTEESYDADMINKSIERAAHGLGDIVSKVAQIASETELTLYNGISTQELDEATISAAVQNIKEDPDFDIIATRLLLKVLYKNVLGHFETDEEFRVLHRDGFVSYVRHAVDSELLRPEMASVFNLERLADALDPSRDGVLRYIGLRTMMKRYMICGFDHVEIETPQYFRMRVAMGLSLNENDPTEWALKFYEKLSRVEFVNGGSANVGAGTRTSRLSNCYLLEMHDSIDHIAKTISDVMKLSKATGGIGLSVTKLRSSGSPVRSNNTKSSGPIPFLHTLDSTLRAVSRAGKKMGALCFYMENWHLDFDEFVDLKQNAGDEYRRTRTANTAVYLSDEFMKRVKNDDQWYLFDPGEVPDLCELYGEAFGKRYNEYVRMAEEGKMARFKKVLAKEQYRHIIVALQSQSHPWLTWKDAINVRALNNNTGTIHCSNLCTEVCLPQDGDNISVCNLTYINLSNHFDHSIGDINWTLLEDTARKAVRILDNIVDINQPPVPEAVHADKNNRAVGLGLMGFTETIEHFGYAYDSDEAYAVADKVFEFVSFMAIDESANLAQERGSYPNFDGSMWSKGYVPIDTLSKLSDERGEKVTVDVTSKNIQLNWDALREKVKKGMRNATVMAIAPNANAGLIAGTSPGLDPRFAQIFSRSTNSAKYMEINENLVNALKNRGIWEEVKDEILSNHGDISSIDIIPDEIKRVYKTSFSTSPYAYIEVAARAQKWIDQAISRNMYIETRDVDEMMNIYMTAWEKGLKTTYYCFMKPRHRAEQSTVHVNKAEAIGKKGFGTLRQNGSVNGDRVARGVKKQLVEQPVAVDSSSSSVQSSVDACPIDPHERLACESCQ